MNLRKIALVVMCAATAGLLWSSMGRSLAAEETDASDTETMTHNSQQIAMSLLAVYLPVESQVDAPKAAEKVIARHSKKFKVLNAWPKPGEVDLPFVVVAETNTAEYAPPSTDSLKYFGRGLDEKQAEQLQLSKRALTLSFVYPRVAAWTTMQEAYAMLDKVASETEGFIWDEHTRLVYSPEAWREKFIDKATRVPRIADHIAVHSYRNGEHIRAITLGMAKFGLPDVVVEESPASSNPQIGLLLNAFCQRLAEGAEFESPGKFEMKLESINHDDFREEVLKSVLENAKRAITLTLQVGDRDDGDPENDLIELRFDEHEGPDDFAKQELALMELFGSKDEIHGIKHDEEIEAASERARAKLPELQKAFEAGLKPGELILVKAPFKTADGDREFMWVEISSWKADEIGGTLQNEPFNVPELKAGQKVTVSQAEVFDYLRLHADGTKEGNETSKLILESQQ